MLLTPREALREAIASMGYTKLFSKILASSIWNEDDKTRLVWVTMLAMQNERHIVEGSIGGLAHQARVSVADCQKAIDKLLAPDPDDSSKVADGRRIEAVSGGWIIVNGEAYRKARTEDERKIYHAAYMRKWRQKQKNVNELESVNVCVNNCEPPLRNVTPVKTTEQNRTEQNKQPYVRTDVRMNAEHAEKLAKEFGGLVYRENKPFIDWCKENNKAPTVVRFRHWLENRKNDTFQASPNIPRPIQPK